MYTGLANLGLFQNNSSLAAAIRALLFPTGTEQGGMYDWSVPSVWQDSAGSTPGVIGQPAGLELDSRLGMARGVEQVANPNYAGGGTGWTPTTATPSYGTDQVTIAASAGYGYIQANMASGPGWYEVSAPVLSGTSAGSVNIYDGIGGAGGTGMDVSPGNTLRYIWYTPVGITMIRVRCVTAGQSVTFGPVSVKPLPGNHISQSTNTARGTLQQGYCDLSSGDDFYTSATGGGGTTGFFWCGVVQPTGGDLTVRNLWADSGTNLGYIVRLTATNAVSLQAGDGVGSVAAITAGTIAVGERRLVTVWQDGTNLNAQINLGAVATAAFGAAAAGTSSFTVARSNTAASQFLPGYLFPFAFRHSQPAPDAATRLAIQQRLAAAAGVTL